MVVRQRLTIRRGEVYRHSEIELCSVVNKIKRNMKE